MGTRLGRDLRRALPEDVRARATSLERGEEDVAALTALLALDAPLDVLDSRLRVRAPLRSRSPGPATASSPTTARPCCSTRPRARTPATCRSTSSRATTASSPSRTRASTSCSTSSAPIGYWGEDGDAAMFSEFRRVLRPGGRLVLETMHRDRLAARLPAARLGAPRRRRDRRPRSASSTSPPATTATTHVYRPADGPPRRARVRDAHLHGDRDRPACCAPPASSAVELYGAPRAASRSRSSRRLVAVAS